MNKYIDRQTSIGKTPNNCLIEKLENLNFWIPYRL